MILIETFFDSAEKLVRIYHPETRRKTEYEEALEDLANAIIMRAVDDYAKAKLRLPKSKFPERDKEIIAECQRFFESEWYRALCPLMDKDAGTIIALVDKYYDPYAVRRELV